MEEKNLKNAVIKYLQKEGIDNSLTRLKEDCEVIKTDRSNLDDLIQKLRVAIIKTNIHLLIDKIHRGDYESVLKILNNTRERQVFYDFIEILDDLLCDFEKYYQNYDLIYNELLTLKENFGFNDHKLHKVISGLFLNDDE
jgi:hypothetical protein